MLRPARVAPLVTLLALTSVLGVPTARSATSTTQGLRCTIVGTDRAERLTGTAGRDVICGLGGGDVIEGRGGNDVLAGGAGGDVLAGGPGDDTLAGNGGNDDLTGNTGSDRLDGDTGTNWCTPGPTDVQIACAYDESPPTSRGASLSAHRVDVTAADREVVVRVRVLDDTGVASVAVAAVDDEGNAITASGHLVEGTVRDGWWEATLLVARWSAPGTFGLEVSPRDRVGRRASLGYPDEVLAVVDATPDTDLPQVELRAPTMDSSYDVRTSGRDVTVRARIEDAVSGVWYADFCLLAPREGFYGNLPCARADLVDGDLRSGVWQATLRIPKGETGGDWNVAVATVDRAHKDGSPVQWVGPDVYRHWTDAGERPDPSIRALPGGTGRFPVVGTVDSVPPVIDALTLTPDHVDTLDGPAHVTVTVRAHDARGEGVRGVGLALTSTTDPESQLVPWLELELTDGTAVDGTWSGSLTLPQGSPPSRYWVQAWVEDVRHFRSYVSSDSPFAGDADQALLPGDPHLVVGDGG